MEELVDWGQAEFLVFARQVRRVVMAIDTEVACFGGFGLTENPNDLWFTNDGVERTLDDAPAWNAEDPENVKYDFDSTTVDVDGSDVIMTFGGDRETFDFEDPENYLRVDSDVWSFGP